MSANYKNNLEVLANYSFIWTSVPTLVRCRLCMRDIKPQRFVQLLKLLKVTRNATNLNKHINEASKQTFANNLF